MSWPRRLIFPTALLGTSILLGGWFLQEGVSRDQNVYLQVRLFQEVMDHVTEEYVDEVDQAGLYESAIQGVLGELGDPNSSFISAREWEDFRIRATDGDYAGVGLEVLARDGYVTVVSPIPGGPGARAGIRTGDRFLEIAGERAAGWPVERAVEMLRGEPGTSVEVRMDRPGVDEPIPFTLTREVIQLLSVPFTALLDGDVGYIPLQVFRTTSSDEVRDAIADLRRQGARGIVLDLRGNPGGLLEEGIDISDLFLEAGETVVETRGRGPGQSERYSAGTPDQFPDLPVAILVDEASASASEIVAGALQDHDRALVVGAPTFGKGSVQTLFRLSGGNVLRLTTALWYTPVGRSIQAEHSPAPTNGVQAALTLDGALVRTADGEDRPEFRSRGGRLLLGGGGIVPDRWVIQDTLSTGQAEAVRSLYRQAGLFVQTLFGFAVEYIQEQGGGVATTFRMTDALVDRFVARLRERGLEVDEGVISRARPYIARQLEREIALQAAGEEGRFLRMLDRDRQLQAALEWVSEAEGAKALVASAGVMDGEPEPLALGVPGSASELR